MIIVTRNFNGLLIPSAVEIPILSGTEVKITQAKGGSATILVNGQLVRVDPKDLDAIGLPVEYVGIREDLKKSADGNIDLQAVWEALKTCYDPEIPVNIVDLGLIYGCKVLDHTVIVSMTLTAPMCGMGPTLITEIKNKVLAVANVLAVDVDLIFDPPWTVDRMSEVARSELGLS